jgi:hypothetical protein
MSYKQLTPDQFAQYSANPLVADELVRKWAGVPDNKYFSVSVWPETLAGRVYVTDKLFRTVKLDKISKSNQ